MEKTKEPFDFSKAAMTFILPIVLGSGGALGGASAMASSMETRLRETEQAVAVVQESQRQMREAIVDLKDAVKQSAKATDATMQVLQRVLDRMDAK